MSNTRNTCMGRFLVTVELASKRDLDLAEAGHLPPDRVRRQTVEGWVDTGATRLVLPQAVVDCLGLNVSSNITVRYADGRRGERALARDVHLAYGGRSGVFSAVVEPGRDSALIGAIVLEELDLIPDCTGQRLLPRYSRGDVRRDRMSAQTDLSADSRRGAQIGGRTLDIDGQCWRIYRERERERERESRHEIRSFTH